MTAALVTAASVSGAGGDPAASAGPGPGPAPASSGAAAAAAVAPAAPAAAPTAPVRETHAPVRDIRDPDRAARLEALLGDPFDPANPHGHLALLRADETRVVPEATEELLEEAGLGNEFVPRELGGDLGGLEQLARVLRPVFRRDLALGYGFGVTSLFAASAVWTAGDEAQREALAKVLLRGGRATTVHREVAHANAILRSELSAWPQRSGGYLLNGRKDVVLNAHRADQFVMYVRTAGELGPDSHSVMLLDPAQAETGQVQRLPRVEVPGMRSAHFSGLRLAGVAMPESALVGPEGGGLSVALRSFQLSHCMVPATVIAGVDSVLRLAVRAATEGRADGQPARRWHKVLAEVFADLLACDAMAVTGLRALTLLPEDSHLVAAAVKYTMPDLLREDLEELATVLGARGYDRGPLYGGFQKLVRDLPVAGLGHAGTAVVQAVLVPQLPALARSTWFATPEPPAELFRPGAPLPDFDARRLAHSGTNDLLSAALVGASGRLDGRSGEGPLFEALAGYGRTFVEELRVLRDRCVSLGLAGSPAFNPQAIALTDRYALVLAAGAVLGVWENQAGTGSFLEDPSWALLALSRIGRRLGVAMPELPDGVTETLLAEVLSRYADRRSLDLYGTGLAG
ncbi:acyl-CoA dehydrogenase [Streptomyces sp. NPDC089919]|uniref:acyl-CoA dehydrogenase n=1 Tax=Streptomyces sp. NPDC089919 TaxID=3155188 RepID=UPI003443AF7F